MLKKKIVIISQTITPAQFPRSFRATELAVELAQLGNEVILYAVLGSFDYSEFQKENNITVKNIGKTWFTTLNSDGKIRQNIFDKILKKCLNRSFEFPDIELVFWIPRIIKREKNVDVIISIAMPYPIHWGVSFAKILFNKKFPKTWIADCGDPYMGNISLTNKPHFYFKYIERWFCKNATYLTVPTSGAINGYYRDFHEKIKIIPQGFKFIDLPSPADSRVNNVLTFAYAGMFYEEFRNPTNFLEFLVQTEIDFKFIVYTTSISFLNPFIPLLNNKLVIRPLVKRDKLLIELSKMDFLINFENGSNIQIPSKLIDYALTHKPILSINHKNLDIELINQFLNKDYSNKLVVQNIDQYNIKNVAQNFLSLTNITNEELLRASLKHGR